MKIRSVSYLTKEGVKNLWANRLMTAASVGVLMACMVLIGYDAENVILHDPSKGESIIQTKELFVSNWEKLFKQAIIIE